MHFMTDLEKQIWGTVKESIGNAISERVKQGYGEAPLNKLIDSVVAARQGELRALIEESIDGAISGDFRKHLKEAAAHKIAKVLVSKMEGEIEKQANDLRSNPETRAKITLAISGVIKSLAP